MTLIKTKHGTTFAFLSDVQKARRAKLMRDFMRDHVNPQFVDPNSEVYNMQREVSKGDPENYAEFQHQYRVMRCQFLAHTFSVKAGGMVMQRMICGDWHECPDCRAVRVETFRAFADNAHAELGNDLVIAIVTEQQWSSLRRKLSGRPSYRKMPLEGDTNAILIDQTQTHADLSVYEQLEYSDLDWDTLIETPKGKRPSGDLGRPYKEPEADEPTLVIEHTLSRFDFSKADKPRSVLEAEAEDFAMMVAARSGIPEFDKVKLEQTVRLIEKQYTVYLLKRGVRLDWRYTIKNKVSLSAYTDGLYNRLIDKAREDVEQNVPNKLWHQTLLTARGVPLAA